MSRRCDRPDRRLALAGALLAAALSVPGPALGHGALVTAETAQAIRLLARYDTGAPMAAAPVTIHAPDDPAEVWGRGLTDAEGGFEFLPDPALPGRWTVRIRQAGHGAVAHVEMAPDGTAAIAPAPQGWLQRAVMVALVAWGALGTALWFARGRGGRRASA